MNKSDMMSNNKEISSKRLIDDVYDTEELIDEQSVNYKIKLNKKFKNKDSFDLSSSSLFYRKNKQNQNLINCNFIKDDDDYVDDDDDKKDNNSIYKIDDKNDICDSLSASMDNISSFLMRRTSTFIDVKNCTTISIPNSISEIEINSFSKLTPSLESSTCSSYYSLSYNSLNELPAIIIENVMQFLGRNDALKLRLLNKNMKKRVDENEKFWKKISLIFQTENKNENELAHLKMFVDSHTSLRGLIVYNKNFLMYTKFKENNVYNSTNNYYNCKNLVRDSLKPLSSDINYNLNEISFLNENKILDKNENNFSLVIEDANIYSLTTLLSMYMHRCDELFINAAYTYGTIYKINECDLEFMKVVYFEMNRLKSICINFFKLDLLNQSNFLEFILKKCSSNLIIEMRIHSYAGRISLLINGLRDKKLKYLEFVGCTCEKTLDELKYSYIHQEIYNLKNTSTVSKIRGFISQRATDLETLDNLTLFTSELVVFKDCSNDLINSILSTIHLDKVKCIIITHVFTDETILDYKETINTFLKHSGSLFKIIKWTISQAVIVRNL